MTVSASNSFRVQISASTRPAWVTAAPLLTWTDVPGSVVAPSGFPTAYGQPYGPMAYSGGVMCGTKLLLVAGGGHADYFGNEVYAIDLSAASPAWSQLIGPSALDDINPGHHYNNDGRPVSQHTYSHLVYSAAANKVFFPRAGTYFTGVSPKAAPYIDHFDLTTNTFSSGSGDVGSTYATLQYAQTGEIFEAQGVVLDGSGRMWLAHSNSLARLSYFDTVTGTGVVASASVGLNHQGETAWLYDSTRNRIVKSAALSGANHAAYYSLSGYSSGLPAETRFDFSGSITAGVQSAQWFHCVERDSYLLMRFNGTTVEEVSPTSFAASTLSIAGTPPYSADSNTSRWYGRWAYVPSLKICVLASHYSHSVKFFRVG